MAAFKLFEDWGELTAAQREWRLKNADIILRAIDNLRKAESMPWTSDVTLESCWNHATKGLEGCINLLERLHEPGKPIPYGAFVPLVKAHERLLALLEDAGSTDP